MVDTPGDRSIPDAARAAADARAAQARPVSPLVADSPDPIVIEGRRKFHRALEDELLDYKHNGPIQIESCVNTLLRVFEGAAEHPRIKATSKTFSTNVTGVKGGEKLMMLAGWKTEVEELQKYWVWDGAPGSHKHAIMLEGCKLLHRALSTIHEKAERKRHEAELQAAELKARQASIMSALEEDKLDRRTRNPAGVDQAVSPTGRTSPSAQQLHAQPSP